MMKCEIIKDLMPSYIDEITSEESNLEIQKHLKTCSACHEYEASMRQSDASTKYNSIDEEKNVTEIRPFKKVKKALAFRAVLAVILVAALAGTILYGIYESYWYGRDASVEDVQIEYKAVLLNDSRIVALSFQPAADDICLTVGYQEVQTNENDTYMGIIKWKAKPSVKNSIIVPSTWEYCFLDENTIFDTTKKEAIHLSGDEKLIIKFAGGVTKEIRMKDLYTGEGLDKLGIVIN